MIFVDTTQRPKQIIIPNYQIVNCDIILRSPQYN